MASAAVILGSLGAGFAGLTALRLLRGGAKGADKFVRGGFKGKMDRSEAIQILGLRDPITANRLKDAHRMLMLANHPDRGGSPYLAGKVNEAKVILEKEVRR